MTSTDKAPFFPGEVFTMKNATYKVKSVSMIDYHGNGKPEWYVTAWRLVKSTQKYSSNAYSYSAKRIKEG